MLQADPVDTFFLERADDALSDSTDASLAESIAPTRQLSSENRTRALKDADPRLRLLPGGITLSLINKELEEVEATLRASHGALPLLKRTGPL